ncbi:MAG TPA: MFS transporter, partial [Actinomycetota bacterium]
MSRRGEPTLRQNLRGLPREAWILFVGAFVNRLGTFVLPFITLYLRDEGYSAPVAGLGLAAYGVGGLIAQAVGGLLADRIGRRNAIVVSMTGGGLCALALTQVSGLVPVVLVVLAMGLLGEIYRPASSALVADLVAPESRVAAFSAYRLMLNLGWAVGLALGGLLFDRSPDLLFVGDAITSFGFAAIALLALPHGTRTTKQEERHLDNARVSMRLDRGFLLGMASVFIVAAVYMQSGSTFALHVQDLGYSATVYGLLLAANGVLVVLFELPITAWTQHRPRTRMMALGGLFVGLGFFTLVFVGSIPGLALMIVVWTFGEIVESPSTSAFVAERAPEHLRGRYQGMLGSMYGVAAIVSPLVGTTVYHLSPTALWIGCGVVAAIGAGFAL